MRKALVEKDHPRLSVRRQSELLGVNRNRLEVPKPAVASEEELALMRRMDELALRFPEFGARRMAQTLSRNGPEVSRDQTSRLMKKMGLEAVYRRPRTSIPAPGHKIYPYLLRDRAVAEADEVWCADIPARGSSLVYIRPDPNPMEMAFAKIKVILQKQWSEL